MNTPHEDFFFFESKPRHLGDYDKEADKAAAENDNYVARHAAVLTEENQDLSIADSRNHQAKAIANNSQAPESLVTSAEDKPGRHKRTRRIGAVALNGLRGRMQPVTSEKADDSKLTEGFVDRRVAAAEKRRRTPVVARINESEKQPGSVMGRYTSVEQMTYKNGQKHFYGIDENGRRRHLSSAAILENYGYDKRGQSETAKKPNAKKSAAKAEQASLDESLGNKSWGELNPKERQRYFDNLKESSVVEQKRPKKGLRNRAKHLGAAVMAMADEYHENKYRYRRTEAEKNDAQKEERRRRRVGVAGFMAGALTVGAVWAGVELSDNDDHDHNNKEEPGSSQTPSQGPTAPEDGQKGDKDGDSNSHPGRDGRGQNEPSAKTVGHYKFENEGVRLRMIDTDGDGDADKAVATLTPGGNIWNASEQVLDVTDGPNRQPTVRQTDRLKDEVLRETKWNERSAHNMPVGTKLDFKVNGKKVTAK